MGNIIDERSRWRWWYESISDWMIANPGGRLYECAAYLQKSPNTISVIVNSNAFKDFHALRRREWRERHDETIISKTTEVAEMGLDLILDRMKSKRDQIPLSTLKEVTGDALQRLGYTSAPPPGAAGVNVTGNATFVTVSAQDLAEARAVVRQQEQKRLLPPIRDPSQLPPQGHDREAEHEGEVLNAPLA
jgi:hypothetical protein